MSEPYPVPSEPVEFENAKPLPPDNEAGPGLPQNLWFSINQTMQWNAVNVLDMKTSKPYKEPPVKDTESLQKIIENADAMRLNDPQYTDKRNLGSMAAILFVTDQAIRDEFAGKTTLEVGSGAGELASDLSQAGAIVTELDFSQMALDSSIGLCKLRADGSKIPLRDGSYEASISMFSASIYTNTINDRLLSYAEIFRITKPGGRSFVLPVYSGMVLRMQRWFENHQPGHLMTRETEFAIQQQAAMDYATTKFLEQLILEGYINFTPVLAQQEQDGVVYDMVSGIFDIKQTLSADEAKQIIAKIASKF